MYKIWFLLFFITFGLSKDFTVASYNVENLFDLKYDGTEYKEFRPSAKGWNRYKLNKKLQNISKVINNIDSTIIALQEIESQKAFELLKKRVPKYKYGIFKKNKKASIGLAFLSKYPIVDTKLIQIDKFDKYARPLLVATFKIQNYKFKIINNHWRSKRARENERVKYAFALQQYLYDLNGYDDYILVGDFNSNYDEFKTFKYDKKLNNTYNLTGINDILRTSIDGHYILKDDIIQNKSDPIHYNLWFELPKDKRFSYKFGHDKETPDNIILPHSLFDNQNISYVDHSFRVFAPRYLYLHGKINRWNNSSGYSDHLPIIAKFSTQKQTYQIKQPRLKISNITKIHQLYSSENLSYPIKIDDAVVIYKYKNNAIIKQKNDRAIYLFGCANSLKLGYSYSLDIDKTDRYNQLLEVLDISNIDLKRKWTNYKRLYINAKSIKKLDLPYINEIVTNLKGIYKRKYLYFDNKKVRLYFPKNFRHFKNGKKLLIKTGHITIFKGKIQISIHKKDDLEVIR